MTLVYGGDIGICDIIDIILVGEEWGSTVMLIRADSGHTDRPRDRETDSYNS